MEKLQHKRFFLIAALCLTAAFQAFAQTNTATNRYGLSPEVPSYYDEHNFVKETRATVGLPAEYKKENRRVYGVDNLGFSAVNGHHWQGETLTTGQDMNNVYLVNVKTGEYLDWGAEWGTTTLTNYAGMKLNLKSGKTCRADELGENNSDVADRQVNGNEPNGGLTRDDRIGKGYLIQSSFDPTNCIGRQQTSSGAVGTFEMQPYMVDRSASGTGAKEYTTHIDDTGNPGPGQFVFYFYPVQRDGKQYYVIYTHRQTTSGNHEEFYLDGNGMATDTDEYGERFSYISNFNIYNRWRRLIEFDNRDSYLCLRVQEDETGKNMVTYKKFAGQMFYDLSRWELDENTGEYAFHHGLDSMYFIQRYNKNTLTPSFSRLRPLTNLVIDDETGGPKLDEEGLPIDLEGTFRTYYSSDENTYAENVGYDPAQRLVSLADGLDDVILDDACLWKIVTEEDRYNDRFGADLDNPYDVTYFIDNPNFYTYRRPYETGSSSTQAPDFGWTWTNSLTDPGTHSHPYNGTNFNYGEEFHKIGTNYPDRWGFGKPGTGHDQTRLTEARMTQGQEGDYVGSIYKGSAALSQTIEGLMPGRYILYCRAFYAPHDMTNFDNLNGFGTVYEDYDEYGSLLGTKVNYTDPENVPTWSGGAVPSDVTNAIRNQPQSETSFLYATSNPDGSGELTRKRKLPSIYSGMIAVGDGTNMQEISSESNIFDRDNFCFTPLGDQIFSYEYADRAYYLYQYDEDGNYLYADTLVSKAAYEEAIANDPGAGYELPIDNWEGKNPGSDMANKYSFRLLQDSTVFAKFNLDGADYFVPRNLTGAARFFNASDPILHEAAQNYRIGLPVEVGVDGKLTIGINHQSTNGNEWVCFDQFQLIYYGNANPWDFVIDESSPQNCTRYHDLFDWEKNIDNANQRDVRLIIKRSLDPSKFVPIVLPVSLTKAQVKEAFGDGVKISEPDDINYNTIFFKAVSTDGDQSEVAMQAYHPYIVKPSAEPAIKAGETLRRTRFARDDNNPFEWSSQTVNFYLGDSIYVPKAGRNRSIYNNTDGLFKDIEGPLFVVNSKSTIKKSHYKPTSDEYLGAGATIDDIDYKSDKYNAANQWIPAGSRFVGNSRMKIVGNSSGKEYQLRATCYYDPTNPNGTNPNGMNEKIPPYSYYFSNNNLLFNGSGGSLQKKGFSFYLQIVEAPKAVNILNQSSTNPNATDSGSGWFKSFTSNADSGVEGVVVSADPAQNFKRSTYNSIGCYGIKPEAANSTKTVTITAPAGYNIAGYKIGGYANNNETYTLTAEDGTSIDITGTNTEVAPMCLENYLEAPSTTFTVKNNTTNWKPADNYVKLTTFIVYLYPTSASGSAKVFAGNVADFQWVSVDDNEVTGVTETFREYENPANDFYYDLQGRPVKTPQKNGIYIYHGKKIVY